ncbi:MAG: manganese efflux pump MntP family protein [Methanomicrobiales archaeon]|nr:manganese efflux pump MntP family protein [Methanomicrobiales archaeon]
MDAMAVSICAGLAQSAGRISYGLKLAALFGLFQFGMPVLGWIIGTAFDTIISGIDHWLAFGILAVIGAKMLYESRKSACSRTPVHSITVLLALALATSIDAFAVGLSYAFLAAPIALPALTIGIITFILSFSGYLGGSRLGDAAGRWAELSGGAILLGIGIKILLEHLLV